MPVAPESENILLAPSSSSSSAARSPPTEPHWSTRVGEGGERRHTPVDRSPSSSLGSLVGP